jgi:hypothetical protein
MKKRYLVSLLALLISAAFSAPSFGTSGSSWIPTTDQDLDPTFHSVTFQDYLPLDFNYSVLRASDQYGEIVCKSSTDSQCATKSNFHYNSILKVCELPTDTDCIESLSSLNASGKLEPAKFSTYTVSDHINSYPGDKNLGIPEGSVPSIWNIPSLPHASGTQYAVVVGENGGTANTDPLSRYMQVSVIPVVLKDFGKGRNSQTGGWSNTFIKGVYYDFCQNVSGLADGHLYDCGHVNEDDCLLPTAEQGICYAVEDFAGSPKLNIQLKLSKEPNGWLHGRMTDPNVSISKDTTGNTHLSVAASISHVPMVYQGGLWANLPANLQQFWVDCFTGPNCGMWGYRGPNPSSAIIEMNRTFDGQSKINSNLQPYAFGKRALAGMAAIAPLIGDKASAFNTSWSFRTLTKDEMSGANSCITGTPGIKGIVSTNSTTYSAGPPELVDGSLQYQVASAHYMPDGKTAFRGTYNLVMRSDVARCIYGFTSAPISASISVVSSDGNTNVATTVTGEHNGWISLSANNFEFSSPTIKVKFTQTDMKKSVTCTKGKTKKIVSGSKPKCPSGWKLAK